MLQTARRAAIHSLLRRRPFLEQLEDRMLLSVGGISVSGVAASAVVTNQAINAAGTTAVVSPLASPATAANQAPVLEPIAPISLPIQDSPSPPTDLTVFPNASQVNFLTSVNFDSAAYLLQQQYQFTGVGYMTAGSAAYVLSSPTLNSFDNPYYLIRPSDGSVFPYDGSGSYTHSYDNSTTIAILGDHVYTDPTLLLDAQPADDYTFLQNLEAQYQFTGVGYFTAGTTAYVLSSPTPNSFSNQYCLIRSSDGAVFAYDGSGSFAHSFTSSSPIATLGPSLYTYPDELTDAQVLPTLYNQLYQVDSQLDLHEQGGSYDTNYDGHQAEWLYSPILNQYGEHWYTLTLQQVTNSSNQPETRTVLTAWEGYSDSTVGTIAAIFPTPSVYENPALLTEATAQPIPPAISTPATASVSLNSSVTPAIAQLTITLTSGYEGMFSVTVTAAIGAASVSQTVEVDATPSISISAQPGSAPVPSSNTEPIPVTPRAIETYLVTINDAQVSTFTAFDAINNYSPLFAAAQRYRFQGVGYMTAGSAAYVLTSPRDNGFGNSYYLLSTSGGLYPYDGSGSYSTTIDDPNDLIMQFDPDVYYDPSLLINAQPPVDYSLLYNLMQQYQFQGLGYVTAGTTAYVFRSSQPGPVPGGYYLLAPNGGLYAYDGSGNYNTTFANSTNLIAQLDPGVYVNPSLLLDAGAAPGLYAQLQATELAYDLRGVGYSTLGAPAYELTSPENNANGNPYYLLSPSGGLYAYDGSGNYNTTFDNSADLVATLDPSVYENPALLVNATAPEAATGMMLATVPAGVVATLTDPTTTSATTMTYTLTVTVPASFVGSFQLAVVGSDTDFYISAPVQPLQPLLFTSTDTPPVPTPITNSTSPLMPVPVVQGTTLTETLGGTSSQGSSLTYTASVGHTLAYNLQSAYLFQGIGYITTYGTTAYVLSINGTNQYGNQYYLLNSSGGLYAYDGSGNFATSFAHAENLVQFEGVSAELGAAIYKNPLLLIDANATPNAVITVSGTTLTVDVAGVPVGTIFQVLVTASDGAESGSTSFYVMVTQPQ
jgi:hypothetical protein